MGISLQCVEHHQAQMQSTVDPVYSCVQVYMLFAGGNQWQWQDQHCSDTSAALWQEVASALCQLSHGHY